MEEKELFHDNGIERDLHLARFYDEKDPILGPPTGDIYIDKPWTRNFLNRGPVNNFDINLPFYKNYYAACRSILDDVILYSGDGQKYTNRDIIEMSEKFAAWMQKMFGRPKVAMFVNNTVEEPVSLIATSLSGGEIHPVDVTKTPNDMKKCLDVFQPNVIVMDEKLLPLIPILNIGNVPIVVVNAKKEYNNDNMFSFDKIMELGQGQDLQLLDKFDPKAPFLVITSSGTTGAPKPIVLSSYSVNLAILKVLYTDYPLNRDNIMIKVIPAHIGLGIITTLCTCLISGTKLALIEGNGPEDSVRLTLNFIKEYPLFREKNNLLDYQKLLLFAAPMFYRALLNYIDDFSDLSYISCMLAAGAKMSKEELDKMSVEFGKKGCKVPVCVGYGSNENVGAVTLNINSNNMPGSGGFPVIGTDVYVVDDNNVPILNKEGRIIVRSGSQFLYYLGNEQKTKESMITLGGDKWFEMNDIGYMDENGFVHITGRISRVVVRCDCKISIDAIEEKIRQHLLVSECAVVVISENGADISYAFVTYRDVPNYEKLMKDIMEGPGLLSDLERPDYLVALDDMPYISSGKVDYVKLKEYAVKDYETLKGNKDKFLKRLK